MSYQKKYAKGSGSHKVPPTKDGEIQTAGLGAVIGGAAVLGTYAYLLHKQYKAKQASRRYAIDEEKKIKLKKDKDSKK